LEAYREFSKKESENEFIVPASQGSKDIPRRRSRLPETGAAFDKKSRNVSLVSKNRILMMIGFPCTIAPASLACKTSIFTQKDQTRKTPPADIT
jgi:hypothetical protein